MKLMEKLVVVFVVGVLAAGSMVFADDLVLPPWQRGADGTTFQEWSFSTDETMPAPDFNDNPYGDPLLKVVPVDVWQDYFDGREGVWPLSGEIDVYIPNREVIDGYKDIWLQLVWKPALEPDPFLPPEPSVGVTPYVSMESLREDTQLAEGWIYSTFWFRIYPNPIEEWITIRGNILVDQLVIDTICVPEPATFALLGIGGLLALARKRRSG